ncbi:MAG: signal peptidase I [Verrucomicrobiales bacterium]
MKTPLITQKKRVLRLILGLAFIPAVFGTALVVLVQAEWLRLFHVPTGAMAPAIAPGDRVVMESVSYLRGAPARGDIVIFRTDGIERLPAGQRYTFRVVGMPGEHILIKQGQVFINRQPIEMANEAGRINYVPPGQGSHTPLHLDMTVPVGEFFVLGDNSANSFDSRFYGTIPPRNILGRVVFCYWPWNRARSVR